MLDALYDYWERGWWWLSDVAERLSCWLHPGYRIPPLTPARYEQFMAFWREIGMEEAYESAGGDEMLNDGMGLQGLGAVDEDGDAKISEEEAEKVRRRFEEEGRLTELTALMFDVPEGRAGDIPLKHVEGLLADFIVACAQHRMKLLGMQSNTTSS